MDNGALDMTSLIIAVCVIIPALIAISVCGIIFYAHRKKDWKFQHQRSVPNEYDHSRERIPQNNHIIDFSHTNRYRHQRHLHEPSPEFEQSPPSYHSSVNQTRRQQLPLFTPIRTTPATTRVHQTSSAITPSIHSAMPPSYAEIFLSPHTVTYR